jgi:hypothetical protein
LEAAFCIAFDAAAEAAFAWACAFCIAFEAAALAAFAWAFAFCIAAAADLAAALAAAFDALILRDNAADILFPPLRVRCLRDPPLLRRDAILYILFTKKFFKIRIFLNNYNFLNIYNYSFYFLKMFFLKYLLNNVKK